MPIEECGEPLVDLRKYPLLATDRHPVVGYRCETQLHCREDGAERLLEADRLLPGGLRLLIVECHRPVELQVRYWRGALEALRERHLDWLEDRLVRKNAKFVAPPWGVPPHSTGGALDVVPVYSSGREPDMGSPINAGGPLSHTAAPAARYGSV